jgi:hypothetical protein
MEMDFIQRLNVNLGLTGKKAFKQCKRRFNLKRKGIKGHVTYTLDYLDIAGTRYYSMKLHENGSVELFTKIEFKVLDLCPLLYRFDVIDPQWYTKDSPLIVQYRQSTHDKVLTIFKRVIQTRWNNIQEYFRARKAIKTAKPPEIIIR